MFLLRKMASRLDPTNRRLASKAIHVRDTLPWVQLLFLKYYFHSEEERAGVFVSGPSRIVRMLLFFNSRAENKNER